MTPAELREFARLQRESADAAERLADAMEAQQAAALTVAESSANTLDMTKAQLARRGQAVATARAEHPVALAIVSSKWGTLTAYAKRLRISQGTLSKYIAGKLPTPPEVAERVQADFGLGAGVWPSLAKR